MADSAMDVFLAEAQFDYIGLWEVMVKVRSFDPGQSSVALKSRTLHFVSEMLARGFLAVDLLSSGGCQPWENQDPRVVLERIEAEWSGLGREPNIGDIAWFSIKTKMN
jgi:hypothetical protein